MLLTVSKPKQHQNNEGEADRPGSQSSEEHYTPSQKTECFGLEYGTFRPIKSDV